MYLYLYTKIILGESQQIYSHEIDFSTTKKFFFFKRLKLRQKNSETSIELFKNSINAVTKKPLFKREWIPPPSIVVPFCFFRSGKKWWYNLWTYFLNIFSSLLMLSILRLRVFWNPWKSSSSTSTLIVLRILVKAGTLGGRGNFSLGPQGSAIKIVFEPIFRNWSSRLINTSSQQDSPTGRSLKKRRPSHFWSYTCQTAAWNTRMNGEKWSCCFVIGRNEQVV